QRPVSLMYLSADVVSFLFIQTLIYLILVNTIKNKNRNTMLIKKRTYSITLLLEKTVFYFG
ncbi:MAG: hypothetical protein PUB18_05345, partial [bacterium]|nr:hypothetical protein [bacterium]